MGFLNVPTVVGATLMFCSVAAMTLMQMVTDGASTEPVESTVGTVPPSESSSQISQHTSATATTVDDDSDTDSLASFIACEFMGTPLRERALRQRCHVGGNLPAQVVGVVA